MTSVASTTFEKTLHKSNRWLADMMKELGTPDPDMALGALRAGLHTLRDRLTVVEACDLAAQMPMLIRGLYFEGWQPSGKPVRLRHADDFLAGVYQRMPGRKLDATHVMESAIRVLYAHMPEGELEHIRQSLPHELRELWPVVSPSRRM